MALDEPSSKCMDFLVGLLPRYYEVESSMAFEMKYIWFKEEGISKFQQEMKQRMMQALHVLLWMDETLKN
jgi:hypothetical protein